MYSGAKEEYAITYKLIAINNQVKMMYLVISKKFFQVINC